ncbi:MAG: GNAT family N-acetyltransferase [Pseudomonadota bacterium]
MKPLLEALGAWDAKEKEAAFASYYDVDEVRVIMVDGQDVGWIQVSHTDQEFCLDQLHLIEEARGKGIGTVLIKQTIADAAAQGKNVSLSLVKGNRAVKLYKRLGFHQVAEDETKIHKRYVTGDT